MSAESESDDGAREPPEPPAPSVEGFSIERNASGEVRNASVTVTYWDQDHGRTIDVGFRVHSDGVARFRGQNVGSGSFSIEHDLVPLITASMALEEADFEGIHKVPSVKERVSKARHEARRADLEGGEA